MARHYLSETREVHPGGPWRLAGYCFGTIVAFEMAQQLTREGEEVELLAMFNGPSPAWIRQWGWYGNQPGWRARNALPPRAPQAVREVRRFKRYLRRTASRLARIPRLVRDPTRIANSFAWYTRYPRTRVLLALGLPVLERHREDYFFELHGKAELAYNPTRFPGEIIVLYGDGLYEEPALGWDGLGPTRHSLDRGSQGASGEPPDDARAGRRLRQPAAAGISRRYRHRDSGVVALSLCGGSAPSVGPSTPSARACARTLSTVPGERSDGSVVAPD